MKQSFVLFHRFSHRSCERDNESEFDYGKNQTYVNAPGKAGYLPNLITINSQTGASQGQKYCGAYQSGSGYQSCFNPIGIMSLPKFLKIC